VLSLTILPFGEAHKGLRHTLLEVWLARAFPMRPKLPLNFAHVQFEACFLRCTVDIGIGIGIEHAKLEAVLAVIGTKIIVTF